MTDKLTYGQRHVGLTFNPSGDYRVHHVKQAFADVIDHLKELQELTPDPEAKRHYAIAVTEAQGAQMWAVKAITWPGQDHAHPQDASQIEPGINQAKRAAG